MSQKFKHEDSNPVLRWGRAEKNIITITPFATHITFPNSNIYVHNMRVMSRKKIKHGGGIEPHAATQNLFHRSTIHTHNISVNCKYIRTYSSKVKEKIIKSRRPDCGTHFYAPPGNQPTLVSVLTKSSLTPYCTVSASPAATTNTPHIPVPSLLTYLPNIR